jgi:hypothetical protein
VTGNNGTGRAAGAGYSQLPNFVMDQYASRLGPTTLAVYCGLLRFAGKDGRAWPSHNALAALLGCSRNTVIAAIRRLEAEGLVEVERANDGKASNTYRLGLAPPTSANNGLVQQVDGGSAADGLAPVQDLSRGSALNGHEPNLMNQTHSPKASGPEGASQPDLFAADRDGGFGRFWALYPRKEKKKAARREWASLAPDAAMQERILAAVAAQASSDQWRRDGGRFIPSPDKWLNDRRWEDEPPASTADTREDHQAKAAAAAAARQREREEHRRNGGSVTLKDLKPSEGLAHAQ